MFEEIIVEKCPDCKKELLVAEFDLNGKDTLGVACEDMNCGFTNDIVDENGKYLYTIIKYSIGGKNERDKRKNNSLRQR